MEGGGDGAQDKAMRQGKGIPQHQFDDGQYRPQSYSAQPPNQPRPSNTQRQPNQQNPQIQPNQQYQQFQQAEPQGEEAGAYGNNFQGKSTSGPLF